MATSTYMTVNGMYVSSDEQEFVDMAERDIARFVQQQRSAPSTSPSSSHCLLFPMFSARLRFLMHSLVQQRFCDDTTTTRTVSIGDASCRRTVVYFSEQPPPPPTAIEHGGDKDDVDSIRSSLESATIDEPTDEALIKQAIGFDGQVVVEVPTGDYDKFTVKEVDVGASFAHVLELCDFPAAYDNKTIATMLAPIAAKHAYKWVDDTHVLLLFESPAAAEEALACRDQISGAVLKPMADACAQSKSLVRRKPDSVLPFKSRPKTNTTFARRMVSNSLGIRAPVTNEQRQELDALRARRAAKKVAKQPC